MIGPLIIHGVPMECINIAAVTYHVAPTVILSVLNAEGGRVGMAKPNANGTYDYGPMQINSIWLNKIKPYGYTREAIQYDPCINVAIGTWILSNRIGESHNFWKGAAAYHSYTTELNQNYQVKIRHNYELLSGSTNE